MLMMIHSCILTCVYDLVQFTCIKLDVVSLLDTCRTVWPAIIQLLKSEDVIRAWVSNFIQKGLMISCYLDLQCDIIIDGDLT